ncbi:TrkA family potassium uptake protein [Jatrophihabitans telluris]|uniref:Trk system potassium uptake protein TrkA n=1 Tax=Jatrophihabitans telluris TaxID=2038343 RepID=A0ABY4R664_9ACTN|nr:TrkA family potassium uptake protein [Jatrophihabitans telluris]
MHIVVMGCGRVGSTLAHHLQRLDHSVAVIDQDPTAFRRLGEEFRGKTIAGIGFDRETLVSAGIEGADAFAAVSSGDNSNIIAARVARETFNVGHVVARIYDPRRAEVYERLGIPTIATVPWTAARLLKNILGGTIDEEWRDPTGQVVMLHVVITDAWVGHKLSAFESATGARVALISRFGKGELPGSHTVIQAGDELHVTATDNLLDGIRTAAADGPIGGLH